MQMQMPTMQGFGQGGHHFLQQQQQPQQLPHQGAPVPYGGLPQSGYAALIPQVSFPNKQLQVPQLQHLTLQQQQQVVKAQQKSQRVPGNAPSDDEDEEEECEVAPGGQASGNQLFRHAPPAEMTRPCRHNDWDDVRTRKGSKILRCRTCQSKWKLPSARVPRCSPFLSGHCERGESCSMVHVHKRKSNLMERFERFGDSVLRGVPAETWEKVKEEQQDPLQPVSPTAGVPRKSSSASAVPSLLSTDTSDLPSPTAARMRGLGVAVPPVSPTKSSTPPSLLCSPTNQTAQQRPPVVRTLNTRRSFAPPAIDTTTVNNTSNEAWTAATGTPAALPTPQGMVNNPSLSDSQVYLPPDLLSPVESMAAPPSATHKRCPYSPASVQSMGTDSQPTSPGTSTTARVSHRVRMSMQLAAASAALEPTEASAPAKPRQRDNEGVHAMTEAELDAHLEKLGLSPQNTPKAAAPRPTTLPVQKDA